MDDLLLALVDGVSFSGDVTQDVPVFLRHHGCENTAEHCAAVAEEAGRIAERFGVDAERAKLGGWLHDVSAVFLVAERLGVARALGVDILPEEERVPMLLHQKLSVVLAREVFVVHDPGVLDAIGHHTTLRLGATELEKVVFVADKMAWDQSGAPPYDDDLRRALTCSLDAAALCYLHYLWQQREHLPVFHPWSLQAYKELREKESV